MFLAELKMEKKERYVIKKGICYFLNRYYELPNVKNFNRFACDEF